MHDNVTQAVDWTGRAESIVNSSEALRMYASCEWEELSQDGQLWMAQIVRLAATSFPRPNSGLVEELEACETAPFPHAASDYHVVLVDEPLRNRILAALASTTAQSEAVQKLVEALEPLEKEFARLERDYEISTRPDEQYQPLMLSKRAIDRISLTLAAHRESQP